MRLFCCLLFICITFITKAQTISFQKTIGENEMEWGADVIQLLNGDYWVLGQTKSFGTDNFDVYLIKLDSLGNVIWTKVFTNPMDDYGNSLSYSKLDSSIYIVGKTHSFGYEDIFVQKLNLNGDTLWSKRYGGAGNDLIDLTASSYLCSDGGLIITGKGSLSNYGIYILKLDNKGDTLWTKESGSSYDRGESVTETYDGYIINGLSGNSQVQALATYLIKLNFDGDTVWTKTYDSPQIDQPYKTLPTKDGGYITCGHSHAFGSNLNYFHIYVFKTDSFGDTLWTKSYMGDKHDYAYDMETTSDGGYIISGETNSFGFGGWDAYLLKIDSIGNIQWMKTYGGSENDYNNAVTLTSDGGYIMPAYSYSFGGNGQIYLIKTDSLGNSGGCNEMDVTSQVKTGFAPFEVKNIGNTFTSGGEVNNITVNITSGGTDSTLCNGDTVGVTELEIINNAVKIFPNPATNHLWIEYQTINAKEFAEIRIFDLLGKETLIQKLVNGQQRISTSSLENGVYIYRILINEIPKESGKLIIRK